MTHQTVGARSEGELHKNPKSIWPRLKGKTIYVHGLYYLVVYIPDVYRESKRKKDIKQETKQKHWQRQC